MIVQFYGGQMTSFDVSYKGIESSNFESPLPNLTYIYIYIYKLTTMFNIFHNDI